MTDCEFISALSERGIKAELIDGVVMMLLSDREMRFSKKYDRIVAEIGWKRSWGRKVVRD